jgi:hypothetical protein
MSVGRVMLVDRLREAAAVRGEEVLAELPGAVRRLALLMLVLAVELSGFPGRFLRCLGVVASRLTALRKGSGSMLMQRGVDAVGEVL